MSSFKLELYEREFKSSWNFVGIVAKTMLYTFKALENPECRFCLYCSEITALSNREKDTLN